MKHTPGPWKLRHHCGSKTAPISGYFVDGPDDLIVANVGAREGSGANARLIAAAPELLDALKAYEAAFDALFVTGRPISIDGVTIDHSLLNRGHELAHYAIAKAEPTEADAV